MTEPLGYTCPCGTWYGVDPWTAGHWSEQLQHTCTACQRTNILQRGTVLNRPRKKTFRQRQGQIRLGEGHEG